MKNIYLLVGPSGSGKSSIAEKLQEEYGYKQVYSYTERPPRSSTEKGHVFVTSEEFDELGTLCAYTIYNGYRYGVTPSLIDKCDVYVIDPPGVEYMKKHYVGCKGIYVIGIDCPETECRKRMILRGDSIDKVEKRLELDKEVFKELYNIADCVVMNTTNILDSVHTIHAIIETEEQRG